MLTSLLQLGLLSVVHFQPTKQDKAEFEEALCHAARGHLPVRMWLFYEFLVHNGELEGSPRLDKDLFFYCEVLKFKVSIYHLDRLTKSPKKLKPSAQYSKPPSN